MIKIQNLSKSFKKHHVLRNLNLNFETGKITALVGPNACGKTTLIRCVLGLVIPSQGQIFIDQEPQDSNGVFRKKIGYMPQVPSFPGNLSSLELFAMLEDLRKEKSSQKEKLIQHFHIENVLKQPFEQLSGGTKQKIAAVMTFMFDAPIIILDEPTAGLDPLSIVRFKELLTKKVSQGTTVVLTSHIMTEVEQLAHNLVFINEGSLVFSGKKNQLLEKTQTTNLENAVIQLFEEKKN